MYVSSLGSIQVQILIKMINLSNVVSCLLKLDSMEAGQVDQEDIAVASPDPMTHIMQDVKGNKVLATPAVRRLALENKVHNPIH